MDYKSFITSIKQRFDAVERIVNEDFSRLSILECNWIAGRDIYKYSCETGKTPTEMERDMEVTKAMLQKCVRFYSLFPKGYASEIEGKPLAWSHYAAIIYIGDSKVREFYLKESALQGWSSHELRRRIRNNYYENRQEYSSLKKHKAAKLKDIPQKLYTYSAEVLKVIDADTFKLNIDVGFNTRMKHKVRLRGINCPELKTKKGEKAKRFVEKELGVVGYEQ